MNLLRKIGIAIVLMVANTGLAQTSRPGNGLAVSNEEIMRRQDELNKKARTLSPEDQATADQLGRTCPDINFNKVALADVVDFMHDVSGLNISVGWAALEYIGTSKATPISLQLHGVSYRKIFELVLDQCSVGRERAGYVIKDGIVTISTVRDLNIRAMQEQERPAPKGQDPFPRQPTTQEEEAQWQKMRETYPGVDLAAIWKQSIIDTKSFVRDEESPEFTAFASGMFHARAMAASKKAAAMQPAKDLLEGR